jgi:hypothetical protein
LHNYGFRKGNKVMYDANTPGSELARLLAGLPTINELDMALKAGRLPINSESRRIVDIGLYRIKAREGVKPELVKAFKTLADAANVFVQVFRTDAGRQAVSILEEAAIWHHRLELTKHRENFDEISERSILYYHYYVKKTASIYGRPRDRMNCLLYDLYSLYVEIKIGEGGRPGIAGPLYRFTKECIKILGEKLPISQDTFRMRIQRLKRKRD